MAELGYAFDAALDTLRIVAERLDNPGDFISGQNAALIARLAEICRASEHLREQFASATNWEDGTTGSERPDIFFGTYDYREACCGDRFVVLARDPF